MGAMGLGIEDKEPSRSLTDPLDEPTVIGAAEQGVDAIQRVGTAAAGGGIRGFRPLIDHGKGKAEVGGDLLGTALLEDVTQNLV